jgi:hypothetical protein
MKIDAKICFQGDHLAAIFENLNERNFLALNCSAMLAVANLMQQSSHHMLIIQETFKFVITPKPETHLATSGIELNRSARFL